MPLRRLISSGSPFETAFGYSRAVVDGDYVFVSGTTGYDYATMTMPEDVADQARNVAKTFAAVLAEAGAGLADIVRLQTFVTSPDYCEPVLRVAGEIYANIRPAAGIYVVAALLRLEMKVEIEATARIRRA
jgi:enamine deaminase RidA (YjgF/YER057c/UK114 family)